MLNNDFLEKAFSEIEHYIQILKKHKGVTAEELQDNTEKLWMISHGLQLTVQALMDIGTHILSEIKSEPWEDYADVPRRLGEHKIISNELAETFIAMVKMRNKLAHEYIFIDTKKVANVVNLYLDDVPNIVIQYQAYLETKQ